MGPTRLEAGGKHHDWLIGGQLQLLSCALLTVHDRTYTSYLLSTVLMRLPVGPPSRVYSG